MSSCSSMRKHVVGIDFYLTIFLYFELNMDFPVIPFF